MPSPPKKVSIQPNFRLLLRNAPPSTIMAAAAVRKPKPATSKPATSKPATSKPATSKPAPAKPGPSKSQAILRSSATLARGFTRSPVKPAASAVAKVGKPQSTQVQFAGVQQAQLSHYLQFHANFAARVVPRDKISVPVWTGKGKPSDRGFFEDPKDPHRKLFLPRYELAEETVAGITRYRLQLQETASGGVLDLSLLKTRAPELGQANQASELSHELGVSLRYTISGRVEELVFQTLEPGTEGARAVLEIVGQAQFDRVLAALQEFDLGAELVIHRRITVAVPAPIEAPSKPRASTPPPRPRVSVRRVTDHRPPALRAVAARRVAAVQRVAPPAKLGFRQTTLDLSTGVEKAPFVFPKERYAYLYQAVRDETRSGLGLRTRTLEIDGRWHHFFQDRQESYRFFYLPDSFKLARSPQAPHIPQLTLRFHPEQDGLETATVDLDYIASPFVDLHRLASAEEGLRRFLPSPLPAGIEGPELTPLSAANISLRLDSVGGLEAETPLLVDLQQGIHHRLSLPMKSFQELWASAFETGHRLFKGFVIVEIGEGPERIAEEIPFDARLDDLVGPLFEISELPDPNEDRLRAVITNRIESPVRIDALPIQLVRENGTGNPVAGVLERVQALVDQGEVTALPIRLVPGAELRLAAVPSSPLAGDGPLDGIFDLAQVSVELDAEAVFGAVVDISSVYEIERTIDIKTWAFLFEENPEDLLLSIVVELEGGSDVELEADALEAQGTVAISVEDLLLRRASTGSFRYRLRVFRRHSEIRDSEWRTESSDMLRIRSLPKGN